MNAVPQPGSTMRRPRRKNPIVVALYVNAALLLAVLVAVLGGGRTPSFLSDVYAAPAGAQPIAGAGNIYLMPAQFVGNQWGCYVMDVENQRLCAYQWFAGEKKLRLVAARNFANDLKLGNFNTDHPMPDEVANLLELERSGRRDAAPQENEPKPADEAGPAPAGENP